MPRGGEWGRAGDENRSLIVRRKRKRKTTQSWNPLELEKAACIPSRARFLCWRASEIPRTMDADELFARQLQEEEDRASVVELMRAESAASSSSQRTEFAKRLDGGYRTALAYGKPEARAVALALIPLARLEREADELVARTAGKASEVGTTSGDDGTSGDEASSSSEKTVPISRADAVLRRLLWWFKNEFFTWCDAPVCVLGGTAKPTLYSRAQRAAVCEWAGLWSSGSDAWQVRTTYSKRALSARLLLPVCRLSRVITHTSHGPD